MAIEPGEKGRASDFIYAADISATQADDEGKVAKLGPNGRIQEQFIDHAFGDGSDGTVVLDGSTDFNTFSSRSGSDYTLTRDVYFSNLTINGGVNLITAGWRIFVKNTIAGSGKISWNGNNGSDGQAGPGHPGDGSSASGGSSVTGYFSNQAGTGGGAPDGQSHGGSGGSGTPVRSALGFAGGQGGSGGTHSGDTGGVGTTNGGSGGSVGSITTPSVKFGVVKAFALMALDLDFNSTETFNTGTTGPYVSGTDTKNFEAHSHTYTVPVALRKLNAGSAGTGGGAGGGSNASNNDQGGGGGGGGGASGGIIFIVARVWAGTFEIEARGGNGGNGGAGSSSVNDSAGGGGGGGGAGGVAVIIYQFKTWSGTFDFAAGTGGTGGAQGGQGASTPAGSNGADGTAGDDYQFFIGDLM